MLLGNDSFRLWSFHCILFVSMTDERLIIIRCSKIFDTQILFLPMNFGTLTDFCFFIAVCFVLLVITFEQVQRHVTQEVLEKN